MVDLGVRFDSNVTFCLSVTLVYCGQTVGWIKMKLGMQVGLGPGHFVLDGDTAPLPKEAHPLLPPKFLANICCGQMAGWMDQDATWYGGRPRPTRHYVR